MRFPRARPLPDSEERILPLINVVFLLLVFFMLAGHLASSDPLGVEPPESVSERVPEAAALVLLVAADGAMALEGHSVAPAGLQEAVAARLRERPGLPVHVKADADLPATRLLGVLERLVAAGARRVRLLTVAAPAGG